MPRAPLAGKGRRRPTARKRLDDVAVLKMWLIGGSPKELGTDPEAANVVTLLLTTPVSMLLTRWRPPAAERGGRAMSETCRITKLRRPNGFRGSRAAAPTACSRWRTV